MTHILIIDEVKAVIETVKKPCSFIKFFSDDEGYWCVLAHRKNKEYVVLNGIGYDTSCILERKFDSIEEAKEYFMEILSDLNE